MIGAAKGVIRSMVCNGDLKAEIIPVDIAVNGLIVIPYYCSLREHRSPSIPVFNITIPEERRRTWKWIMDEGRDVGLTYPYEIGLWYPDGNMTMNKFYHWFCVVMFMWIPAYLVDFLFFIFRQPRFMLRVQTKVAIGLEMLQFFTTRAWHFKSNNFKDMYKIMSPDDRKNFKVNTDGIDDKDYMVSCCLGGRQYVMKEPMSSIAKSRALLKFLYCLDRGCKIFFVAGIAYWINKKLGIIHQLL